MAHDCRRVAIHLSGGLDSAIVAAALAQSDTRLQAINLRTPGADGDERPYARAVADRLRLPLTCVDAPQPTVLSADGANVLRPGFSSLRRNLNAALAAAADDAEAVFTGAGGDNVFFRPQNAAPLRDRWRAPGARTGAWRTVMDLAEVNEVSVWRVLRAGVAPRPALEPRADLRFLNLENFPSLTPRPAWLEPPSGTRASHPFQIAALLAVQNHLYGIDDPVPQMHPLLCEPVVEACLDIAPWHWVDGGRDRALARLAFARDLPEAVLQRRGKGRLDSYGVRLYELNRDLVREILFGGRLTSAGWLDLAAVGAYLAVPGPPRDHDFYRLMELADLELWLANAQLC